MSERFALAHVSPHPWEERSALNAYIRSLADQLRARGHTVLVLAPSHSSERVRSNRELLAHGRKLTVAALAERALESEGCFAIAEALGGGGKSAGGRAPQHRSPRLAIDQAGSLEALFAAIELDFVHVHEPLAPGLANGALRHSRALNLATFQALPRAPIVAVARRLAEGLGLLGRLDGASATLAATAAALTPILPVSCHVIPPGWEPPQANSPAPAPGAPEADQGARSAEPVRLLYFAHEERTAQRTVLRALRHLPAGLDWRALLLDRDLPAGAESTPPLLRESLRARVARRGLAEERLQMEIQAAQIAVFAGDGRNPDPAGMLNALACGAAVLGARIPPYEELLGEGERGLLFEPGDIAAMSAQLARLIDEPGLRKRLSEKATSYGRDHTWERAAAQTEELYRKLAARRHRPPPRHPGGAQERTIDVDLHMHTDHSPDCATPVKVLLETARERGLGAIAVTDHNEISGALAAHALAERYGVKVIVGEEIKTASEGEVIGLFLKRKIERGLSLAETIAQIKAQGGVVYVPHPFDRLHAIPDYANLLPLVEQIDALEVYNARVAIGAFNDEAARFATKYRIPAGAGSDAHVPQGLGSVRVRMADFSSPEEFLAALPTAQIIAHPKRLLYVQALKFIQTRAGGPQLRRLRGSAR